MPGAAVWAELADQGLAQGMVRGDAVLACRSSHGIQFAAGGRSRLAELRSRWKGIAARWRAAAGLATGGPKSLISWLTGSSAYW
jgi:hypothetical protein